MNPNRFVVLTAEPFDCDGPCILVRCNGEPVVALELPREEILTARSLFCCAPELSDIR